MIDNYQKNMSKRNEISLLDFFFFFLKNVLRLVIFVIEHSENANYSS